MTSPPYPTKKFFLGALGVSAVNCALLHDQRADPDFVESAAALAVTLATKAPARGLHFRKANTEKLTADSRLFRYTNEACP